MSFKPLRSGGEQHSGGILRVSHHASPHTGQQGGAAEARQGHLGGRGAADCHRVAFVRGAAVQSGLVGDPQDRSVGGGVAAGGLSAALRVEAHGAGDGGEGWGETGERGERGEMGETGETGEKRMFEQQNRACEGGCS